MQRYARAFSAEELVADISRASKLDQFKPYICQRWNQASQRLPRSTLNLSSTAGPSRPDSLGDDNQARLAAVRAGGPHLDALAGHIRDFAEMMTSGRARPHSKAGSPGSRPTTSPSSIHSPSASAATKTPPQPGCPCPITPALWKATST